jgi:hypothetical protein
MSLANTFGIVLSTPISGEIIESNTHVNVQHNADNDYEFARKNIRQLVATAAQAATEASLIASSSQLANAFVAASQVLKVALDANKDLMTISKQRVDIAMADGSGRKLDGSNVTNNNLFVGTTADFIKMIKEKKSEDNGTE